MGASKSKSTSAPVFKEFPGAYPTGVAGSREKSGELAGSLESLLADQSFLQPDFAPQTTNEQNLLNSLMDVTAGRGAVRGLGAPTQAGLAESIAPTLLGLRQQDIQNRLGARGQDIGGLLELIGLAMPQLIGGQTSTSRSGGLKIL